jgi:hypothetical protein
LDARKRYEERDRRKIELKMEREACKAQKLERKRIEIEMAKEMRKTTEDLEITGKTNFQQLAVVYS